MKICIKCSATMIQKTRLVCLGCISPQDVKSCGSWLEAVKVNELAGELWRASMYTRERRDALVSVFALAGLRAALSYLESLHSSQIP